MREKDTIPIRIITTMKISVNVGVHANPGTVFDRPSGEEKSGVLDRRCYLCSS